MLKYSVRFKCSWYGPGICIIHIFARSEEDAIQQVEEHGVGFDGQYTVFPEQIYCAELIDTEISQAA